MEEDPAADCIHEQANHDDTELMTLTSSLELDVELDKMSFENYRRSVSESSASFSTTTDRYGSSSASSSRNSRVGSTSSSMSRLPSTTNCHSRVLWVAGINCGLDHFDHHGLRHIFQQIIRPGGDRICAVVLFDKIPSALGITFALSPTGFRGAADRRLLEWLTDNLRTWRNFLINLTAHCKKDDITLELRLCAGSSLAETAVREAHYFQATDIIVNRSTNGQQAVNRKVAKLLGEKTDARVALMVPRSKKVEPSIQMPQSQSPHHFSSELFVDPQKQALVSEMLNGMNVTCQDSLDPYYHVLSLILSPS